MEFVLEFERPLVELQKRIEALREMQRSSGADLTASIDQLRAQADRLQRQIFQALTPWQRTLLSRHPGRPYATDYIDALFTDWTELHGDRAGHDDGAIISGLCRFRGKPVAVVAHKKGRNTKENLQCNFGMPRPEGYRKALRIMQLAHRFDRPIIALIDTPGAYPGIDAEERNQSEAIGRNLYAMASLKTPVIVTVIGEGGSGGALAIAVGDVVLMLQYATYSVISPEGCASILWKSADKAPEAAETLGITAGRLKTLGLIDKIVPEPLGGAHRDPEATAAALKKALAEALADLQEKKPRQLVEERLERLMAYGRFKETAER